MTQYTYEIIGAGIDHTGFYKIWLRRNDGKEIKVTRKRIAELNRQQRVRYSQKPHEPFGDYRYMPQIKETKCAT